MTTRKSKPTLKQVTELAGCSIAVASSVLSGQKGTVRYSDELAERVRDSAQRLGYKARIRRSLSYGQQGSMADVCVDLPMGVIIHPFKLGQDKMESLCVESLTRQLELLHIPLHLIYADDAFHGLRLRERLKRQDLSAAVSFVTGADADLQERFKRARVPLVLVNPHQAPQYNAVIPDDAGGVNQACAFLSMIGARRILYVAQRTSHYSGQLRYKTLKTGLNNLGMQFIGEFDHTNLARKPFAEMIKRHKIDTIVTYNNNIANWVIQLLEQLGMTVPQDMNLLSIAGMPLTHTDKNLTQICIAFDQMGRIAADLSINMIRHQQYTCDNVMVPEYLFVGKSCRHL